MNILIEYNGVIPALKYGGTERAIWYLGKELTKMGHHVTYLVNKGSSCDFAPIIFYDKEKTLREQIPTSIDIIHFLSKNSESIDKPYIVTIQGNVNDHREFDINTVFVSGDHAARFGSISFVYNGMDWDDYGKPDLNNKRNYFHFLGDAAWRLKNVKGAIDVINATKQEKLKVLGGTRLNLNMGFRFTISTRVKFYGMVGGEEKNRLLQGSKGLIFPVKWSEPFGIALTESLYFGCPVFGTPYGSLPEIINKEVGFLSNSKDRLAEEVQNVDHYSRLTCHEYARDIFNSRLMAEAYLKKYEMVLNGEQLNNVPPKLIKIQTAKFLEWN
jgi:glycosyltransferase involved in cell wall biosynthesis